MERFHTIRTSSAMLALGLLLLGSAGVRGETSDATATRFNSIRMEARAYEHGEGVRKDLTRAIQLYCEAARAGDREAHFSLGWIYANGRGVPRDDALASWLFERAAEQGHEHARNMLRFVTAAPATVPECLQVRQAAPLPRPQEPIAGVQSFGSGVAHDMLQPVAETVATTANQKIVMQLVNQLAAEYGVAPRLAFAVIAAESNFNPTAISPKNAQGLMQLIPETSTRFNVTKPFDPVQNVRGGLAYLRWLLAYFQGNVPLVLAAYNAGEGTVNRYRGIPPFVETRAYVKRIMQTFGRNEHPYDATVTGPSPALYR